MARIEQGNDGTSVRDGTETVLGRSPLAFARDTVITAYRLKTGNDPGDSFSMDIRAFSMQKAKAMRLGMRSFPTFVIRTNTQRSSYSLPGREDGVLPSGGPEDGE